MAAIWPFDKRHFHDLQMHVHERRALYFDSNFTEVCSYAPNRRQAIIWINADPVHRRIYAALGKMNQYCAMFHFFSDDLCNCIQVTDAVRDLDHWEGNLKTIVLARLDVESSIAWWQSVVYCPGIYHALRHYIFDDGARVQIWPHWNSGSSCQSCLQSCQKRFWWRHGSIWWHWIGMQQ